MTLSFFTVLALVVRSNFSIQPYTVDRQRNDASWERRHTMQASIGLHRRIPSQQECTEYSSTVCHNTSNRRPILLSNLRRQITLIRSGYCTSVQLPLDRPISAADSRYSAGRYKIARGAIGIGSPRTSLRVGRRKNEPRLAEAWIRLLRSTVLPSQVHA
jgi:hypothetical protein